jgi:hypothetical protein
VAVRRQMVKLELNMPQFIVIIIVIVIVIVIDVVVHFYTQLQ